MELMHRNPGLKNIRNSWGNKVPVWKPEFSQARASRWGVSRQSMAQSIQIGTSGMPLGEFREGISIPYFTEG
jgi:Cation/multidrug efflux pump